MDTLSESTSDFELQLATHLETLHHDGITALRGAFSPEFINQLRNDVMTEFWQAIQRPGGAIGRGPRRWYVETHPENITGFVELAAHPWVIAMSQAVLGPDFEIVEIGFDVPFEGALYQPWHRDFPSPAETFERRRLTSLAFNITTVDVTADMGPFEIAVGTQWEPGQDWKHQMFPPTELAPTFAAKARRTFPKRGDISCRSALTVHRGTAHGSMIPRPVLVLGVDAPGAGHAALHDMQVTREFYAGLPEVIKKHLACRMVDHLEPITQKHDIEGLAMGTER